MSTQIVEQGRIVSVEGRIIRADTSAPHRRVITNPMTGEVVAVYPGAILCTVDVECEEGVAIKGLPAAGFDGKFQSVRVTVEALN